MTLKNDLEFRTAEINDADAIRRIVRNAYARWVPVIGREPMPMQADYRRAVAEHRIDLISLDGNMLGLIETMLREDHLWIENVAVSPESQGKGFGRRLLAHAEEIALQNGLLEIRLLNAAFSSNVALYEKSGYVLVASEPFMGGITLYLNKRLTEDARAIG